MHAPRMREMLTKGMVLEGIDRVLNQSADRFLIREAIQMANRSLGVYLDHLKHGDALFPLIGCIHLLEGDLQLLDPGIHLLFHALL